jgi:cullin-associated NEDD8-dissociated protein 1
MVTKCAKEITPHIPAITKLCLQFICYDPNYNYEEETEDADEEMECDDEVITDEM